MDKSGFQILLGVLLLIFMMASLYTKQHVLWSTLFGFSGCILVISGMVGDKQP